ncbi:hypothetical protein SAMN06295909_0734 [Plantibacter sp. VKM Ac-1784]|uniref:Uncharacterized protein n=1 Tax=Plantibacter elymi (nom. nud.) TaxID=199708 RepID=A0ABY1R9M0_9MICO|nr:hypothetical protein [Plantibacter sp. VKM Ac-1784]SMQ62424.1 hypothetical protein SAMN06295909_0734 [Plantibacter sp. VKM Ac-1784]
MNAEAHPDAEILDKYLAALTELDHGLLDLLDKVATDTGLSENQALALAIIGLWSRAKDVDEGRVYISVPADSVRFYNTPDGLLLGEGNEAYAEVLAQLRDGAS